MGKYHVEPAEILREAGGLRRDWIAHNKYAEQEMDMYTAHGYDADHYNNRVFTIPTFEEYLVYRILDERISASSDAAGEDI